VSPVAPSNDDGTKTKVIVVGVGLLLLLGLVARGLESKPAVSDPQAQPITPSPTARGASTSPVPASSTSSPTTSPQAVAPVDDFRERALKKATLPRWSDRPAVSGATKPWKGGTRVNVLSVHLADARAWFALSKDARVEEVRKLRLAWRNLLEGELGGYVPDWNAFLEVRTDSGAVVGGSTLVGEWAD
jgi:hypothetical protein